MTSTSRFDWQLLQAVATAVASLVTILLALYVASRAPVDVPARTRIESLAHQITDLQTEVRWLREAAKQPTRPLRNPGRH